MSHPVYDGLSIRRTHGGEQFALFDHPSQALSLSLGPKSR